MGYSVGRGIADITGEAAGCGMLGYGQLRQQTNGIHTRLRSRAFVIIDDRGSRVLLSVNDLPMVVYSVWREVLDRLRAGHGDLYTERNVMITATHTHCGPGGYSYHRLYNSNTHGFRPLTFAAIVDGMVEAAERAIADAGAADLRLGRTELRDASVNRSRIAFERNPEPERAHFPEAVDPQSTVMAVVRDGRPIAAINWFATHGTSMTNRNRLISADNKGYAAYHWERVHHGVDYLGAGDPAFIGAFAQTNAGDMSPNLHGRPGSGPTEDEFENTRIIGERQYRAAAAAMEGATPLEGPVDARVTFVDLPATEVGEDYTGDGRRHRVGPAYGGAAALAGTDEGPAFRLFRQGPNPLVDAVSRALAYRLSPALADSQAPKGLVVPGSLINRLVPLAQERVPVQLIRVGRLHLIGIPAEVTIVAGLRLRRAVAAVVGAEVHDVLVAGYSNGYIHYVTTPEEYEAQRYEGGSTMFGRWELAALIQTAVGLARAMVAGRPVAPGDVPPRLRPPRAARTRPAADRAPAGRTLGEIVVGPRASYRAGQSVEVVLVGAHPNNRLRRGGTYMAVERREPEGWERVADDGDWSTRFRWVGRRGGVSEIMIRWDIPPATGSGEYRLRYLGDARPRPGADPVPLDVVTPPFLVSRVDARAGSDRRLDTLPRWP